MKIFLSVLIILSFNLSVLAQENQSTAKKCPADIQGPIAINSLGDAVQLFFDGYESYLFPNFEVSGIESKDFKNKMFWVKFDSKSSLETNLYSMKDCSVVGRMKVFQAKCPELSPYYPRCVLN